MKNWIVILMVSFTLFCCKKEEEVSSLDPVNWEGRLANKSMLDSLQQGETYLSVYSQIYSLTEHVKHDLTATISMRNTSLKDTIYVDRADYYDTKGNLIRNYFSKSIYLKPMETVEIVIDEVDQEGGTGANFLFQWSTVKGVNDPLFEAIMISTSGQQGLSFTTQGKRIK